MKTIIEILDDLAERANYVSFRSAMMATIDESTKMIEEAAEIYANQSKWISVSESPKGLEVIGFSPNWIDEDFNPSGTCSCYLQDDDIPYWVISKYCGNCDVWHTRYSHETVHSLGDDFGGGGILILTRLSIGNHYLQPLQNPT